MMREEQKACLWQEFLGQIIADPQEKRRIAREIHVMPITLTRWASGESKPREENVRLLLKALPRHTYQTFASLLTVDFPHLIGEQIGSIVPELPTEFLLRVHSTCATMPPSLYPQALYDLILQQMLMHLDPRRGGLQVSVARCVPPLHHHKVRSLYVIASRATPPFDSPVQQGWRFLGSESLAGAAANYKEVVAVQSRQDQQSHFPHRWFEHEQSVAAAPILRQTKLAGCLLASFAHPHVLSRIHLTVIEHYSHLMALAFVPEAFFDSDEIGLAVMPSSSVQWSYVQHEDELIAQKLAAAATIQRPLTHQEAQIQAWQEIEERLLHLPLDAVRRV